MYPLLSGVLCRVLLYNSVAYSTVNQVTLELSTPRFLDPDGIYFCFNNTGFIVSNSTFSVVSLIRGTSLYDTSQDEELIPQGQPWHTAAFFSTSATWPVDPAEYGTVYEVLGTDQYYSGSYSNQRYDDLYTDQTGLLITGVVNFPPVGNQFSSKSSASNVDDSNYASATAKARDRDRVPGNCFLLSGHWQKNFRYQITFQFTNPSVAAVSTTATPTVWIIPLSYDTVPAQTSTEVVSLVMNVRADKYGKMCPMRSAIISTEATMFDPCTTASQYGLQLANSSQTASECVAALQNMANPPTQFPFTAPPLKPVNLTSFATNSCLPGQVLSQRLGGECINCVSVGGTAYDTGQGVVCNCPPNQVTNKVGNDACGALISPDGNATNTETLAAQLCAEYTYQFLSVPRNKQSSLQVVALYLEAFAQQASYFLDWTTVLDANVTFYDNYVIDDRIPYSPTRRTDGIRPNCNRCRYDMFENQFAFNWVPPYDNRFGEVNMFRFIGYLLHLSNQPCPALWDVNNPLDWKYGYYNQTPCKKLPADMQTLPNFLNQVNVPGYMPPAPA